MSDADYEITINSFIREYGISKSHLDAMGLSYFIIAKWGDVPYTSLPKRVQLMFTAILKRYGAFEAR